DLHYRLQSADKKKEDEIQMAKQLHEQETRDLASKLECYESNEKWQITTIQGLKADLATQHRKNVALIERFQQMGCHDFDQSLPQSMSPPTISQKGQTTSKTSIPKRFVNKNPATKRFPTHDNEGISASTAKRPVTQPPNRPPKVPSRSPPKPSPRKYINSSKQLP
ncbi:unnamed protein product, partial [Owenia fusiformis]